MTAINKRASGVLMHISSLHGDFSIGSFGKEALEFVDFLAEAGFSFWQVLPFCIPDECDSPYKSVAAFSGNPYFIDLPTLAGEGLITALELAMAEQEAPYRIESKRLSLERERLLRKAAARVKDRTEILQFMKENPYLDEVCRFLPCPRSIIFCPGNAGRWMHTRMRIIFTTPSRSFISASSGKGSRPMLTKRESV